MRKMKKVCCLALTGVMVLSMVGCGSKNQKADGMQTESNEVSSAANSEVTNEKGMDAKGFEDLTFAWYKNYDWYSAEKWGEGGEGEAWMRDTYNVNIEYQDAGGAASQKLATMMIDDSYPDVISLDRDQNLQKLIDAKAIVPLDDYIEKYPNLKKYLGEDMLEMFRSKDGKIYVYPNWAAPVGQAAGNFGWLVQKKYHDALGNPELKTFDDLYNYLKAVKAEYPDAIPMEIGEKIAGFDNIYAAFTGGNNPGYTKDKVVRDGEKLKGYLEDKDVQKTYLFLNKLYREKLMTQDTFTMTADDLSERMRNGKIAVASLSDIYEWPAVIAELKAEDPTTDMFPIDPIVADSNVKMEDIKNNWTTGIGWNVNVISKDAKDPEKIFAFLDWWFGNEGQMVSVYGAPGEDAYYQFTEFTEEGFPKINESLLSATTEEVDSKWLGSNWVGNTAFMASVGKYIYDTYGYATDITKNQYKYTFPHFVDVTELCNIVPDFDSEMGILYQTIDSIYTQAVPEILAAGSEEECQQTINKYIKELKDADLQTLLDYQTEIWKENRTKLNIK